MLLVLICVYLVLVNDHMSSIQIMIAKIVEWKARITVCFMIGYVGGYIEPEIGKHENQ